MGEPDLEKLKEECKSMASLLKQLQEEELGLRAQNTILAREVINIGYNGGVNGAVTGTGGSRTEESVGLASSQKRGKKRSSSGSSTSPGKKKEVTVTSPAPADVRSSEW